MTQIALIIDTNSNYSDVWAPCFDRLKKYCKGVKKYVFTDTKKDIPEGFKPILYNNDESYRNQFLSCIRQVPDEYIIYTSEDYILYEQVNTEEINNIVKFLKSKNYSFCKFIKGPEKTKHLKDNLYEIDSNSGNFFAQQASVWNTRDFESVFAAAPSKSTRMQHEPQGSTLCRQLGLKGIQHFSGTPKRGLHHHDSSIFPCIATAVVKGLWNVSEYPKEMNQISNEYKINFNIRGTR